MKKKRGISLLLVVFMVLSLFQTDKGILHAEEIPEDMQLAYDQTIKYASKWEDTAISELDIEYWEVYKILVMEGSFDDIMAHHDDNPINKGQYKYIGYSPDGRTFGKLNNPDYEDVHTGSASINGYDWQVNNEDVTTVDSYDLTAEYIDYFLDGMFDELEARFKSRFNRNIGPHGGTPKDWLKYAHIIMPPTRYSRGVVRFEHLWDSDDDGKDETWYITVNLEPIQLPPEPVDLEQSEEKDITGIDGMTTNASAVILADRRHAQAYNVAQGIPSTEDLYTKVDGRTYIHKENFEKVTGYQDFQVTVTKEYTVTRTRTIKDKDGNPVEEEYEEDVERSQNVSVRRQYAYYQLQSLDLYALDHATINNEALPSGKVDISSTVPSPSLSFTSNTASNAHLQAPSVRHYVTIGKNGSYTQAAEDAVGQFRVRNDSLVFNGQTLMDDRWYTSTTPAPSSIPDAPMNDDNDLFKEHLTIPSTTTNGSKTSSGSVLYRLVGSTDTSASAYISEVLSPINPVVVHTPVVCYPWLSDISLLTQYLTPESDRHQLVIEETFRLDYPTSGEHRLIQGYGNRDYADYIDRKQVAFPFDVYVGTGYDGIFVPKNTWATFNSAYRNFFIPAWVTESVGDIHFRTLPVNLPSLNDSHYEYNANLDLTNYKAVETIPYRINGKLENFSITRCPDDYWKYAFSNPMDPTHPIPRHGDRLPLLPGEVVSIQGKSVSLEGIMLGYPLDFSVITNGDLYHDSDSVSLAVTWNYAPDKNGKPDLSKQIPVDLYRMTASSLIPIPKERMNLGASNRTFIGIQNPDGSSLSLPSGISATVASSSRQQWEGQLLLPNMTYAVPQGTPVATLSQVDVNQEPFLHNGYLVAHVKVFGQKNGRDYMEYGSMWDAEGYHQDGLSGLSPGDLFFYSTDRRASQTYR